MRKERILTIGRTTYNPEKTYFPQIRLQGKWLEKSGFHIEERRIILEGRNSSNSQEGL